MKKVKLAACPICECEDIGKQKQLGILTDDFVCSHCQYISKKREFLNTYKHIHR
ncbi:Eag protein [Photobacterium makurazakiensis]|uniref:Eag protein n=1 Tax=Photobacterium makurazakiensis TaxID=2910234 RepID=UPI003D137D13